MCARRGESTYERWMKEQGLPVFEGHGVEKTLDLPRGEWARMGGKGTFIRLEGMRGATGAYVAEIPPGAALRPEKHLFEEVIYILQGRGATEVWNSATGEPKRPRFFEWQIGSLFAPPLNTWHRLSNASGTEPAVFLAVTSAPMILDIFHNPHFVFNSDYVFSDRYDGREDYFSPGKRQLDERDQGWMWLTNFVPDARTAPLDGYEQKGKGVQITRCELGDGILVSHLAEWPVGKYHKAHYHAAGAVLLTLRGSGYTLLWPVECGPRPYEAGYGDRVLKLDWREGSLVCPPDAWFHQHFNTGPEPARQLAFRFGSRLHGVEFLDLARKEGHMVSVKKGGTLIEYEDEDPAIRRDFERECAKNGVEPRMS